MSPSQSVSGVDSSKVYKVEYRPAQPIAFVRRDIQHTKPALIQEPAYLDYGTSELVEERAYTHLSGDQSPGPPLLKPLRPTKYAQLAYNAPPPNRVVERRTVSLTHQSAGHGNIARNIASKRIVSMPESVTPTQRTVHARLSSAAHSRNTTFSDMSSEAAYYYPSESLRTPLSDMPQTPSPPSSPDSVFFVTNDLGDSELGPLSGRQVTTKAKAQAHREASPPRPIPALHGPSSLPYARCPSGAEGTIVEGEDLTRMIWGLEASERPERDIGKVHGNTTLTQSNAIDRQRIASTESRDANAGAASRTGSMHGQPRPIDHHRTGHPLQVAAPRQPAVPPPRKAQQELMSPPSAICQPAVHGQSVLNAGLKPYAPTFVPKAQPCLRHPDVAEQELPSHMASMASQPARRMTAMEIAQQYRQNQLQPAFSQRPTTPEWSFSPYLEPISAPPTFSMSARPVRHGFDDIYLPRPESPIHVGKQPTFEDIYLDAERLAQVQYYREPELPSSPAVSRHSLPPVIGEHRGQQRDLRATQPSMECSYAGTKPAPTFQHTSNVHLSPTSSSRSPTTYCSPRAPGPPPNTPLPPLPARVPRKTVQEYVMYEDPEDMGYDMGYAVQQFSENRHQPRSIPLARLMQRRLSAVPEELEEISVHYDRPPPSAQAPRATYASAVLRQPLPPSAQSSWRAKTKFPVPKDSDVSPRAPVRVRRVVLVEEDDDPHRWGPVSSTATQDRDNSKRVPLTPMTNRSRSSSVASSNNGNPNAQPIDKENKALETVAKPRKKIRGGRKVNRSKKASNK